MYRNDWDAAVARATALEAQLRQAQQSQGQDQAEIAALTAQLQSARAELARLQSGMPQQMYGQPPMGYASYMHASRASTILVFGILSLVFCQLFGPFAWSMGSEELRRIDAGETAPDTRGMAQAGQICGIIGTVLLILVGVIFVFAMIMAMSAAHRGG
jgi:hypothetical protein